MIPRNLLFFFFLFAACAFGRDYHVAPTGNDAHAGSAEQPLRSISAAAQVARPGDTIIVHAGVYRERVAPPRGGESENRRIVYEAAPGETVVIKGSQVISHWTRLEGSVWKVTLPNSFFAEYNPYKDIIAGDWFSDKGWSHHTGEVYLNGKSLYESPRLEGVIHPVASPTSLDQEGATWTWYCASDRTNTYLYANFHDKDPNQEMIEITTRPTCFYPARPGCDYITVRGFRMCQAATQWAAPTAEQVGVLGTNWSRSWIIEDNVISDSKCVGITLGKDRQTGHNTWGNDHHKDGATAYNEVIDRALAADWSRETIGSHVVRRNVVFNCEQAGICGSLGAVFSQITDNHIYNIWTKRQFAGWEIAGIKIHAAIDVLIRHNRIHDTRNAMWMDWMAQGTRISGNLCYDNACDLFVEVSHGPYVVDNNVFLSALSVNDVSEGGAYAYNLLAGKISSKPDLSRSTPFHHPHSTALAGRATVQGGDDRYYDNIMVGIRSAGDAPRSGPPLTSELLTGFGLSVYDQRERALKTGGNIYCNGARPYRGESNGLVLPDFDPRPRIECRDNQVWLHLEISPAFKTAVTIPVKSALFGRTKTCGLPFENPDGSPITIDQDYFGHQRDTMIPSPGPFSNPGEGSLSFPVW